MAIRQMSEIVRNQRPVTLGPRASVKHACEKMRQQGVGAILVTAEDSSLIGIFTGRDAVRALAEGIDPAKARLSQVMTHDPVTMAPRKNAVEALRMMRDGGFRHVPVVENGKLVGVVSKGDFRGVEHDRLDEETGIWERI